MQTFDVFRAVDMSAGRAWSPAVAAGLARHSAAVYDHRGARIRAGLGAAGYDRVEFFGFGRPGVQAYAATATDHAVIVFRGTEPGRLEDILTDLRADLTRGAPFVPGAWIHRGFWESYAAAAAWVRETAQGFGRGPIYVTGHSLGAALALIAGADLALLAIEDRLAVYTYGAPRTGDVGLAAALDDVPVFRVVRCADVVARRPVLLTLEGYRHCGDLRYLDRRGRLWRSPPARSMFVDRTVARITTGRPIRVAVDHHSAEGYAAALAAIAGA